MKRIIPIFLVLALVVMSFASCGGSSSSNNAASEANVYYLNFKPEQDAQWQALAKKYADETGKKVTVVTAAEGT